MIEVKDERVEIDALKTALLFIYNAYKKVELTGESALAVLYIGIIKKYCIIATKILVGLSPGINSS